MFITQDVDTMDQGDIILLARAMGIDVPGGEADDQADDMDDDVNDDGAADNEDYGIDDTNADEQADLDTAFMVDQTLADAEAGASAATAENVPSSSDDNSHDAIISAFCDITGSDPTSAGHFLEVCCIL